MQGLTRRQNPITVTLLVAACLFGAGDCAHASPPHDTGRDLVVIVHGFGRTARHVRYLGGELEQHGYDVFAPTLPTFLRSVDDCADILAEQLMKEGISGHRRVHFVGHSMGGLIIRRYLADHEVSNLGRVVLVGTPNGGTDLGKIVKTWLAPLTWISPAYESFQPGGKKIPPPVNLPPPLMGAIAGTRSNRLFGWMIEGENDGMVPVAAVPFPGMTDFLDLPFHHDELPFRPETATAIERFLREGQFPGRAELFSGHGMP